MFNDLRIRLRGLFRRQTAERELDDELRFHLEQEASRMMASGLSRQEAARRARIVLGGLDQVKEDCREARGLTWIETTFKDIQYAIRGMRRSPAFAVTALATLALGTGAISTVFTLANTLLFRDLPADHPDQLVVVQATRRHGQAPGWVSYPEYARFRDETRTLEALAAHYSTAPLFVTVNDRAQEVNGAVVSANYFPLLGTKPALGRFFGPDEDRVPDRDRVAVISHEFWRQWFASSPNVAGATIKINGTAFTVIGVTPAAFRGVVSQPNEIYIPTMMARAGYRWCTDPFAGDCTVFEMIGRRRPESAVEQTNAEIDGLARALWSSGKEGENSGAFARRARGVLDVNRTRGSEIRFVELTVAVAGVLLLVCCVNLAGLLVARNSARVREFSIRTSLGACSARLSRQLITESLTLGVIGGTAGVLVSLQLTGALQTAFFSVDSGGHPLHYDFTLEPRVVLAALAVSIAAGFLLGLAPALKTVRAAAADGLKGQSGAVTSRTQVGRWLAAVQAALAVALTVIAGLLVVSAQGVLAGSNFEPSHVALMRLRPRLIQYSPQRAQSYIRAVIERLESLPGVESVSMVGNGAVLLGGEAGVSLPGAVESGTIQAGRIQIGARYFETLQVPVLSGREFDGRDTVASMPVAIVDETMVRRLWPEGKVIGSAIMINGRAHLIVGVVADNGLHTRDHPSQPNVFTPFWQDPTLLDARLCIRTRGDPAAMLPSLTREVNRIDRDVPIAETIALRRQLAGSTMDVQLMAAFVSYSAILAIVLTVVGLYGAMAFSVSRRRKEIGIRLVIGASPAGVLGMVTREGMIAILPGVLLGAGLAVAASRVVRHLLYGTHGGDASVYILAVLLVAGACVAACLAPALRAAAIQPLAALREE